MPHEPSESEDAQRAMYKAENLFPVETDGPNKGQFIPRKDERGNVIIDPSILIKSSSFAIDYDVFKTCVDMNKSFDRMAKDIAFSTQELEVIAKLFATPKQKEKEESHIHKFMKKNSIKRKMITVQRDG